MLASRCLVLNSYLIERYFSYISRLKIGDVKLWTNGSFWKERPLGRFLILNFKLVSTKFDGH